MPDGAATVKIAIGEISGLTGVTAGMTCCVCRSAGSAHALSREEFIMLAVQIHCTTMAQIPICRSAVSGGHGSGEFGGLLFVRERITIVRGVRFDQAVIVLATGADFEPYVDDRRRGQKPEQSKQDRPVEEPQMRYAENQQK